MQVSGTVIQVMPVERGQGKKEPWAKQSFVIETEDKYPKKVCVTVWGEEKINQYDLQAAMKVTAHVNIESREYNGKWYTDVIAWKLEWGNGNRQR
jgi:hypothetical protein